MLFYYFLKSLYLKKVYLFISFNLIVFCSLKPPVLITKVTPIEQLSGRTVDLVSLKIETNKTHTMNQTQSATIGFYLHKKATLNFSFLDEKIGYLEEGTQKYTQGFHKLSWQPQKRNLNLNDLCIEIQSSDEGYPIYYPALILNDVKFAPNGAYQFKFRKSGSLKINNYKIINKNNYTIYQEKNYLPAGEFFEIKWSGRNMSGFQIKPGLYALIIEYSLDEMQPSTRDFKFYHPNYHH